MNRKLLLLTTATALAASACGLGDTSSSGTVNARISLAAGSTSSLSASAVGLASLLMNGPVDTSKIDSIMVTVTRVDVLPDSVLERCHPPEGDSARGFRPGPPPGEGRGPGGPGYHGGPPEGCRPPMGGGPFGPGGPEGPREHPPRPDSLVPPDSGWGARPDHWYSLDVSGNGHIDLLNLPSAGLTLASGSVPAGEYGGARLIVSDATIWFNTAVTARDTTIVLQPNVGYPVSLPHRRGGPMGIMTNSGFTVPDGGGDVQLLFDATSLVRGALVVDSGKVILAPVLHPRP